MFNVLHCNIICNKINFLNGWMPTRSWNTTLTKLTKFNFQRTLASIKYSLCLRWKSYELRIILFWQGESSVRNRPKFIFEEKYKKWIICKRKLCHPIKYMRTWYKHLLRIPFHKQMWRSGCRIQAGHEYHSYKISLLYINT